MLGVGGVERKKNVLVKLLLYSKNLGLAKGERDGYKLKSF